MHEATRAQAEALIAQILDSPELVRFEIKRVSGKKVGEPLAVILLPYHTLACQ